MTLRDYLRIARRRWWIIVLGVVVSCSASYVVTSRLTPMYAARAVLLVNQVQGTSGATYQDILGSQSLTRTYAKLAVSEGNLQAARERIPEPAPTLDELVATVSARDEEKTQLIYVTAKDSDPARAASIANAVAQSFPNYVREAQTSGPDPRQDINTVFLAQAARAPTEPVSPDVKLNLALGLLLGLVATVAVVAVLEYFDDGIASREQIESLGTAFLGGVPLARRPKALKRSETWTPSVLQDEPGQTLTEAYRRVQANLAFALQTVEARVLLVVSAVPGEGKSTTAANLAVAVAESSRRVLLVDGDLRKPDLHHYYSLPNQSGLASAFLADPDRASAFVAQVTPKLEVLCAGPTPPNPSEVISSARLRTMVEQLAKDYELVIIDSSPFLDIADASLWLQMADGVVVVARKGQTRRNNVAQVLASVRAAGVPVMGVVLNGVESPGGSAYRYPYGSRSQRHA